MNFIKGRKLSKLFFKKEVYEILKRDFAGLKYAAAFIGPGSDVLGFDTKRSMDHDWGPRLQLFIQKKDLSKREEIKKRLVEKLPRKFLGFSTHFKQVENDKVKVVAELRSGEQFNPGIEIYTIKGFFKQYLGVDPFSKIDSLTWLTLSEQKLRSIKSGRIFHDQ